MCFDHFCWSIIWKTIGYINNKFINNLSNNYCFFTKLGFKSISVVVVVGSIQGIDKFMIILNFFKKLIKYVDD